MRGLDTNVLIAWVLDGQARPLPEPGPYRISLVVLSELIWVLGRVMKTPKGDLLALLRRMAEIDEIRLDKPAVVAEAINDWADGPADFPDYLLMRDNVSTGAPTTATMDRKAATHPGFDLIA